MLGTTAFSLRITVARHRASVFTLRGFSDGIPGVSLKVGNQSGVGRG